MSFLRIDNRRNLIGVANELTRGYTVQQCASRIATMCIVILALCIATILHRVSGP